MTDVFVRVYAQNHLRLAMVNLALTRWLMEPDICVRVMVNEKSMGRDVFYDGFPSGNMILLDEDNFHIESKRIAEKEARSKVYVLADDDQLIIGKDWVNRGTEIYEYYSESNKFAFIAGRSINGEVPDNSLCEEGSILLAGIAGQVCTHPSNSVGTPYFTRKGLITDFPPGDEQGGGSYDTIFSKHCIDKGYKVGFMRDLRFNHLGSGYSTVVPGHWGASAAGA